MLRNHVNSSSGICRSLFLIGLLLLTSPLFASNFSASKSPCDLAVPIGANDITRAFAGSRDEALWVIHVPEPGLVNVDVSVPASVRSEAVVRFVKPDCALAASPKATVIEQSATHRILTVSSAGDLYFRVSARNPKDVLEKFRIWTDFVPSHIVPNPNKGGEDEDETEIGGGFAPPPTGQNPNKGGEDEDETEIGGGFAPSPIILEHNRGGEDEDETEIGGGFAPSPIVLEHNRGGEDEDETEIGGGFTSDIPDHYRPLISTFEQLCSNSLVDDHGDSFACSTSLQQDQELRAELRRVWEDDEDVFYFVVRRSGQAVQPIEISADSRIALSGTLYDASGQRLTISETDTTFGGFQIRRLLNPGFYYLRVQSVNGAEGDYTLRLARSAW